MVCVLKQNLRFTLKVLWVPYKTWGLPKCTMEEIMSYPVKDNLLPVFWCIYFHIIFSPIIYNKNTQFSMNYLAFFLSKILSYCYRFLHNMKGNAYCYVFWMYHNFVSQNCTESIIWNFKNYIKFLFDNISNFVF